MWRNPPRCLSVLMLAVLMMAADVHSQVATTTLPTPTITASTISTTQEPVVIIIENCPTEGVTAYAQRVTSEVSVNWLTPYTRSFPIEPFTETPSGSVFGVGVREVVYIFNDGAGNIAECVFNVTVLLQCSDPTDIPCDNGVCVPRTSFCDGHNDCGDSSQGSDENCPFNEECNFAAPLLYAVCALYTSRWTNADATGRDGISTDFLFNVPRNVMDTTALIAVRVNVTRLVNLATAELFTATLFIKISLPASSLTETVHRYIMYSEVGENIIVVNLPSPLPVKPNEQISISMEYDDNILTGRPPFPVVGTCLDCISLRYGTLRPGCEDSNCLDAFYNLKNIILSTTLNSETDTQCGVADQNEGIASVYDSCLDPPEFAFVTPSQSSFIGDLIVLRCISNSPVAPLVEWYDEGMNVRASGLGYAAFDISVSDIPQSFTCVLDKQVTYEDTITVSEWSGECSTLHTEILTFPVNFECLTKQEFVGDTFSQDPTRPVYSFPIASTPAVAYRYSMEASVLNPGISDGSSSVESTLLSDTAMLLPLRLEMGHGVGRPRRDIDQLEIYSREYEAFYVPSSGRVTFDLNPPVPLDPDIEVLVTVTVLQNSQFFGERPPPPPATLDAVGCMQSNSSSCDGYLKDWSQIQQALVDAGCSSKNNLSLQAYRTCQGVSTAEPRIINPPKSVDVSLMLNVEGPQEERAIMTCYIENAVEYSWYKVAPVPGRRLIKNGSTLSFQISVESLLDQGAYVCVGKGGPPYESIMLETRPATLTVEGFSMFKVTTRILNREFTDNLTNPNSQEFLTLEVEITEQLFFAFGEVAGIRVPLEQEVIGFSAGSIIVDLIVYAGTSGMQDSELAMVLASAIRAVSLSQSLELSAESVTVVSLVNCFVDQVVGPGGNLTFPETRVGQTAESMERCSQFSTKAGMVRATRECAGNLLSQAYWLEPVVLDCFEGGNVNYLLEDLSAVEVTPDNVGDIAKQTVILTSNHTQIDTTGIIATADILENILNVGNPSSEVAMDIVAVVNNILQVNEETYENLGNDNSPSRIILALEAYITALQNSSASGNLTAVQSDIAVSAIIIPQESLRLGLGFAAIPNGSSQMASLMEEDVNVYFDPGSIPIAAVNASIVLPPEILKFVTSGDQVPISFFFYSSSKLFRSPKLRAAERKKDKFRRAVSSNVIAATVEGVRIENLPMEAPVVSAFVPLNVSNPGDTVNASECVFWNFTLNDGFGDWSTEGCQKVMTNNNRTVCNCNHLTSFAVIVDIYGKQDNIVLSIISKIGCAVSMLALIITIITYLAIKKLRTKRPQQILISFSFALLGLYLVFLVGIEATGSGVGCIIVGVLIHYFTLASIAWMAVEAANMYLLFVRILNANVSHFMIMASIAGWGLPLVVVVVILAVDYTNYENANYCFLRPDNAFYFGQILLIGLVLLVNFVIFTLVMRQLTCARKSIGSTTDKSKRQEVMRRLTNAICISVLLGLTWVFGLLSLIQTASFVFQVFFCIFNSLQGLMIFILFCVRQKEVRQAWVDFLLCRCKDGRRADYSKGAVARSKVQLESHVQGTIPLTNQTTNSTNTS